MAAKSPHDTSVAAEAAAWIAQLQRPDRDTELENTFREWLRSDPAHAAAFEQATTVWNQLPGVGAIYRQRARRRLQWKRVAVAASVLLVAGVLILLQFIVGGDVYVTAVGEQRLVKLQDGSWITLNTDTVVKVRYRASERYVMLERGEAIFDVAKDASRPFVVSTQYERVRALGTSFVVRREDASVSVTLLEGSVRVEPPRWEWGRRRTTSTEMVAGQHWRSQDNDVTTLTASHLQERTAWRHGELVFNETSLRDATAEMNRYSARTLVIQTPAAGNVPISGVFKVRESEQFARTVAALYGLTATIEPGRILISGAPSEDAPR